jgi:stress response protein YsnF
VVDVKKRTVQTGELEVTKERQQRSEKVTDTVRREVVDVDDTTAERTRRER